MHQGKLIKEARTNKALTQKELGTKVFGPNHANEHSQFISNIERGTHKIPPKKISAFAKALGIPKSELIAAIVADFKDYLEKLK